MIALDIHEIAKETNHARATSRTVHMGIAYQVLEPHDAKLDQLSIEKLMRERIALDLDDHWRQHTRRQKSKRKFVIHFAVMVETADKGDGCRRFEARYAYSSE